MITVGIYLTPEAMYIASDRDGRVQLIRNQEDAVIYPDEVLPTPASFFSYTEDFRPDFSEPDIFVNRIFPYVTTLFKDLGETIGEAVLVLPCVDDTTLFRKIYLEALCVSFPLRTVIPAVDAIALLRCVNLIKEWNAAFGSLFGPAMLENEKTFQVITPLTATTAIHAQYCGLWLLGRLDDCNLISTNEKGSYDNFWEKNDLDLNISEMSRSEIPCRRARLFFPGKVYTYEKGSEALGAVYFRHRLFSHTFWDLMHDPKALSTKPDTRNEEE